MMRGVGSQSGIAMHSATAPAAAPSGTAELERLARSGVASVRLARRARIVLLAVSGMDDVAIARAMGVGRAQVARWRRRYAEGGLPAIAADRRRAGRKPKVDAAAVLELARQVAPDGSRLSGRRIAEACGVSDSTVVRIWQRHGLSRRHSPLRPDAPAGAAKCAPVRILGVFLGLRERALAVCVADPAPSAPGPIVFAGPLSGGDALDATELAWLDFLHRIRNACPSDGKVILVCDARRAVSRPEMQAWLAATAGFAIELVPSALAWRARVDQVLGGPQCDRGHEDLQVLGYGDLIATLIAYFSASKCGNVPFVWTRETMRPSAKARRRNANPAVPMHGAWTPLPAMVAMAANLPRARGSGHASVRS